MLLLQVSVVGGTNELLVQRIKSSGLLTLRGDHIVPKSKRDSLVSEQGWMEAVVFGQELSTEGSGDSKVLGAGLDANSERRIILEFAGDLKDYRVILN
jgi:hypothetical protein